MRTVNLIVSCTNRKRFATVPQTCVQTAGGNDLDTRLARWRRNLRSAATGDHRADEVYMGDHWSVVRTIPDVARAAGLRVQLWICSAGYGLIRPETQIKAYQATFARGEDNYVGARLPEDEHTLHRWWDGVCAYRFPMRNEPPRTLAGIAAAFPHTPILVALSADYLNAVAEDLGRVLALPYFRDHLAIVSSGSEQPHATWKHHLLPCDASVAGKLGGALTSLNARIARHLVQSAAKAEFTVEALTKVAASMSRGSGKPVPARIPQSDTNVAQFIRKAMAQPPCASKTRLLQAFRKSGQACEQKRFGAIYTRVRQEVTSGV
jgi:hypothetical protein